MRTALKRIALVAALLTLLPALPVQGRRTARTYYTHRYSYRPTRNIQPLRHLFNKADSLTRSRRAADNPAHRLWLSIDTVSLDSVWLGYNPLMAPKGFAGYRHIPQKEHPFALPDLPQQKQWYDTPVAKPASQVTAENLRNRVYLYMVANPAVIDYAVWQLPQLPEMPADEYSFTNYVKNMHLPGLPSVAADKPAVEEIDKVHWLHVFDGGVQFSQAYLSRNWYQGGNDYLSLLINFFWDVSLNTVYHKNLMFQNTISYKLGLNSSRDNEYHKYNISEDIFQWNMKAGVRARHNWFYSVTTQFKTQFLNNYPADSWVRTASLLSPGDLNVGLGMTYSAKNKKKTATFSTSISPLSYNLKTCIDSHVDPAQFNIKQGHHTRSEIGSSGEATLNWAITPDISLKSRLFVFTDYKYYMNDLETTLSFNITRFLSTQVYAHLRYDSSCDTAGSRWRHWMLKEILSFGFAYHFQTKPK